MAPHRSCGCVFAGVHIGAGAAHAAAGASSYGGAGASFHAGAGAAHAGAGAAHLLMWQLGAVRHVYCKQWPGVRSWVADSAGPVHGLRREHCHDGPLRRQLCGYWTVSSSGEIGTAHMLARGPGRIGLQWAMCLDCARGRVCELGGSVSLAGL